MAYELNLLLEKLYGKSLAFREHSYRWKAYFNACLDRLSWEREHGCLPHHYDRPLGVQLELTRRCNLRCVQCYNDSGTASSQEFSREQWLELARQIGEMGVFEIVISGGEPLLSDCVFDVMDVLDGYGVQFVFITNGWLVNKRTVKRLLKYRYNWVQISIDGSTAETHDRIRGVPGSFKRAITAAKTLSDVGLPVVAAFTACKLNLAEIGEFIDFCGLLGIGRVVIGEMIPVGRAAADLRSEMLTDEDSARLEEIVDEKREKWRDILEVSMPLPIEIQVKMKVLQPNSVLLVRPDGNVRIDCIIPFSVGNLRHESLEEVWARARLIHFNEDLHRYVLEVEDKWRLLESEYGVSYVTGDYQTWEVPSNA
jgi:MoaA/NifB/PqqE/SkfB family radical SAM enzyme